MTRTNPSKTKPRMDQTTDRKQADRKQIIFTEGAKGGGGKTTLLSSLADFFLAESIPVKLIDADIDNKSRGSLSHLFKGTPKIVPSHAVRGTFLTVITTEVFGVESGFHRFRVFVS